MPVPVRPVVDPAGALAVLAAVAAGVGLGLCSGLTPGLHANNFALGLAAVAPAVPGPPVLVAAAMLAAGTTHTFLDVVPALALGVPDPAMAATALPGHQLVLAGRGREALRLSALGSATAVAAAVPLAIPITLAMQRAYPLVRAHLSLLLAAVAVGLVVTERGVVSMAAAGAAVLASGGLGYLTLDLAPAAPLSIGGTLTPLFAGLFGAPILLESVGGGGVPPQDGTRLGLDRTAIGRVGVTGAVAGAVVGYVPGVSAAIAAAGALGVLSGSGPRTFVVAVSAVNTATAIFALFALVALGTPRTGVTVAMQRADVALALGPLLAAVVVAAAVGAVAVPLLGDRYLVLVRRVPTDPLAVAVVGGLVVLSWLFAGGLGVGIFAAATLVGTIPSRWRCRRAPLMGVLLVPLALG